MKKLTKTSWIELGISVGIFVALAIISAFLDLQINKALYSPNNFYGQYFANFGELPTYLVAPVAGTILFYQNFGKNNKINIFLKVLFAIVIFAGYFVLITWLWGRFADDSILYPYLYQVAFSLLLTSLTIFSCMFVPKEKMRKLLWFAIFLIIVTALSNIFVQIMKMLWERQRFRTMTPGNELAPLAVSVICPDYAGFTPWYQINIFSPPEIRTEIYKEIFLATDEDAFKSFPSGHTVAAAASFGLIIVPDIFEKLKKQRWIFWCVPILYTTLVGISRIVVAAHYLSDILFGGFIGYGTACLTRWILISKVPDLGGQLKNKKNEVAKTE